MKTCSTTTMDELLNSVTSDDVEWEKVGRDFFAQSYEPNQVAAFFSYLLDQRFYEQICVIAGCCNIKTKPLTKAHLVGDRVNSAESTYFDSFMDNAIGSGLTLRELMPFFVASFSAPKSSKLSKWRQPIEDFLTEEAIKDYELIEELLTDFDPKYTAYEALVKADKDRAIDMLINRLLFQKHINKTAIRKFLINHKVEVTENLEVYKSSNVKVREAIVRLLLLFKHDDGAAGFLDSISETETSNKVLELVNRDFLPQSTPITSPKTSPKRAKTAKKEKVKSVDPLEEFLNYMVEGTQWGIAEFEREILGNPLKSIIASTLFFSVYGGSVLTDIVVVEQSKICDLDENEITLEPDKRIRVLHPCEIPLRYEYIKRLNIQQGVDQLRRRVFIPTDSEKRSGISQRLKGSILRVRDLKKNMREFDFKPVNKTIDGLYCGLGVKLGDYMCILNFSPTDFDLDESIIADEIRFYRTCDLINIGGRLFSENVPPCMAASIETRIFSELMYSVYRLCGC